MNLHVSARRIVGVLALIATLNAVPSPALAQSGPVLLTGYPLLRQQHSLTCESSAASMGTRGGISESQIMAALPRNPNPNLGFRGNPDGKQGTALVDYGVYAVPLSQALQRLDQRSDVLTYSSDRELRSYLDKGWPVVVWIPYALQPARPRLAGHNGIQFFLVPHEHTVLLVGYDRLTVLANDPWTGTTVRYTWRDFNRGWGDFANMALAIAPCPSATPVDDIRVKKVTNSGATWYWPKAPNAARYDVTVTRVGETKTIVLHTVQTVNHVTLDALDAATDYQIQVRSLSACGDSAAPATLVLTLPLLTAVTPGPTALPTSTPQSSPIAEATSTTAATSVAVSTPKP